MQVKDLRFWRPVAWRLCKRVPKKCEMPKKSWSESSAKIIELGADKDVISALSQTVKKIEDTIKDLGAAAGQRLETSAEHNMMLSARPMPTS